MGLYAKLTPIGIAVGLSVTSFFIGVAFGQVPYIYSTLFDPNFTEAAFNESLKHYQNWANLPVGVISILYGMAILGFIGFLILVYKPAETLKLYDYTSLGAFFLAACVFLTNIRTGVSAAVYGTWGEVDMPTGINVIAASIIIGVVLLFGVLFLQAGRYYQIIENERSEIEYQKALAKAEEEENAAREKTLGKEEKKAKREVRNAKKFGTKNSEKKDTSPEVIDIDQDKNQKDDSGVVKHRKAGKTKKI